MNIELIYSDNSETVRFAASELSKHLTQSNSGFQFPLSASGNDSFSVSLEVRPELSSNALDDVYVIDINSSGGMIQGSNERSVLLAVYTLLRKSGFRFLLPTKTIVPDHLTLSDLYMKEEHHASLRHRGVCIEGADSLENVLAFIDWLPKIGFNSFFLQFKEPYIFLERWYHHVFNPLKSPESLTDEFLQTCYAKMDQEMKKRSLITHTVGHGWTCESVGLPSIGWVTEDKEPSEENRQLLAMINGKREYVDSIPMNTNLCYSNPKAVQRFCDTVISYVKEHPYVDYLHIWLADEPNHICECDECKKITPTDQYVHILNEIDRRLTEENLDCKLVFLLYQELLYPPKETILNNPSRFLLMFAPISRTFKKSYPEKTEPVVLPEYDRNHMLLPVTIEENLTYLYEWQKIFSGDSLVYDYPLGRAHYGDFGYVSISRVLAGDIKNIRSLGLNGYISCQELRAFLPNGLPNYVMGHMLMNTNESFDNLLEEYYSAAYGDAYKDVIKYLTTVSELSDCDYINRIGDRTNPALSIQFQKLHDYVDSFCEVIKQKTAAATDDTLFFWKLLSYHAKYILLLTNALIAFSSGDKVSGNKLYRDFCDFIRKNEDDMQPYLDVYRIIEVTTRYTGFTLPEKN